VQEEYMEMQKEIDLFKCAEVYFEN